MLAKLLPPHSLTVKQVAERENISEPTMYKWRQEAREQGQCLPDSDHPDPEGWTSRDKSAAVGETAAMNALERSEYSREVVDRVRVNQANALRHDKAARKVVKASKWLLLRSPRNTNRAQHVRL
ncbi:hypothetical protein BA897_00010 [Spiribacter roseus]|nr:hypothetical protein BA897_00010 [Spiribacter roseus]